LFFTSPQVLSIIAVGVLGALLVFVGIEMGKHGLRTDSVYITAVIAALALILSMTAAFIIGMVIAYAAAYVNRKSGPLPEKGG
jgi:energy-converting hydrogenase Eha subunit B